MKINIWVNLGNVARDKNLNPPAVCRPHGRTLQLYMYNIYVRKGFWKAVNEAEQKGWERPYAIEGESVHVAMLYIRKQENGS